MSEKGSKVIGRGMQHGTYVRHPDRRNDAVFVKEYVHLENGEVRPNLRMIENPKRPFWITKPGFRNHKEKKEWEKLSKLQRYTSTEANMIESIKNALNMPYFQGSRRMLFRNPYIYGLEVPMSGLIKANYAKQWPDYVVKRARVAALDIETDVLKDPDAYNPIMTSVSHGREIFISVYAGFLSRFKNAEELIRKRAVELLPKEFGDEGEWTLIFKMADSYAETCVDAIEWLHSVKPDWVSIWNLDFDLNRMTAAMERENINVAAVMSDPSVPLQYQYYKFNEGSRTKRMESGKEMSRAGYEQWHTATAPATFQWIDAMATYHDLRKAGGKQPSYALDAVLDKHLKRGKLKYDGCSAPEGTITWHQDMQSDHEIEYVVYNLFDTIGLQLLDEEINDISLNVGVQLRFSEYHDLNSNPTRLQNDAFFFCLKEKQMVTGTVSDQMETELDKFVVDRKNWVATLDAFMMAEPGFKTFTENLGIVGRVYAHNNDLDIEGTYPNEENAFNVSKGTTRIEVSRVQGLDERMRRYVGVDSSFPTVNALWLANKINRVPPPDDWLQEFRKERKEKAA